MRIEVRGYAYKCVRGLAQKRERERTVDYINFLSTSKTTLIFKSVLGGTASL